jgi:hypothetical protein
LAEWLYEEGIGENRAILVEWEADSSHPFILEAEIELPGAPRTGSVIDARLAAILIPGRRAIAATADGDVLVEPLPPGMSEGKRVRIEIVREAIAEPGRPKRAKGRISESPLREAPPLAARIGLALPPPLVGPDSFEEAGWSETLEQAASGEIPFAGGALRMSLTPAMTLFDVDGTLPAADLAVKGAAAAAASIRRFGIGGSIGIDLPTLASRSERQAAAAAIDLVLPPPFERTAVNGFGFVQIVRPRARASLPEIMRTDPAGAAARALLRRAERTSGAGERVLTAAPAVVARLEEHPEWLEILGRRVGASIALRADPGLAISAGHAQSRFPV